MKLKTFINKRELAASEAHHESLLFSEGYFHNEVTDRSGDLRHLRTRNLLIFIRAIDHLTVFGIFGDDFRRTASLYDGIIQKKYGRDCATGLVG